MTNLLYIVWNPSEVIFHVGSFGVRWYAMCWLVGLLLGTLLMAKLYKDEKIPDEKFDPLFMYIFVSVLIGARLGHCLFYQPDYFLSSGKHVVEMFVPIHFMADGSWKFTCLSWRRDRHDNRHLHLCLSQQGERVDGVRQHGHLLVHHGHLHPPGQPHEL